MKMTIAYVDKDCLRSTFSCTAIFNLMVFHRGSDYEYIITAKRTALSGLLCFAYGHIPGPTLVDLTSNFFIICTKMSLFI